MGVTLGHVWLFVTPWTVALQALLSLEFSRQEYWSGLLFSTPGDLPDPGIKPTSLASPELAGGFFTIVVFIHLSSISVFVFIVTLTLILPSSLQLLAAVTISKGKKKSVKGGIRGTSVKKSTQVDVALAIVKSEFPDCWACFPWGVY